MFVFDWMFPLLNADGDIGAEGQAGVEGTADAGQQSQGTEVVVAQTGADGQAAETEKQNNFEKAFAKRLAAKEAEWSERYKDYDTLKMAAEYLQQKSGISDMLTLREQIELERLQERADQANVPPEVLKRIDELEAKAAKADALEADTKQQQEWQAFETELKTFAEGKTLGDKPLDHMALWTYMHENGVSKPEVAYKAMQSDVLAAQLETAKTDAINEYIKSKQAPKVEGAAGAAAQQNPATGGGFRGAEQRALERMRAARTPAQ